jgi:hypothetical protein
MGVSINQPSFSGGEISPTLAARVDLARYQISLKTCRNFMVMKEGGVRNRPGTRFVDTTLNNGQARLIRFKFSIADACLLVFTHLKMRVVRNGAYVLNSAGPNIGLPFELTTPYTLADLPQINYTQSADVMTIVHTLYKPQQLKRFANDNWTITPVSLVPSIAAPTSVVAANSGGSGVAINWAYQVTAVIDDATVIEESLPKTSNVISVFPGSLLATVSWTAVAGATYYNIYKDNSGSGVYGFAGRSTTLGFTDSNIIPTKTDTPPSGLDPFIGAGNFPGAVGYYQQRLVYGGTLNKPQTSYFSRTGVFNNFGYSTPSKDDDAITWTMASTEVNRILNYLPLRQLLTLTSGAEWVIAGTASGFTAKTINGNPQSYNGSGFVPPLVLNDTALYLQGRGQAVSSLNYSLEADGLASDDLTLWSSHLFRDYPIIDWGYQKLPDSIVWAVRGDGKLLGLTYLRRQDVVAWHVHDTDGIVESVACVPEGSDDVVYMVVRRIIGGLTKRYIERFQSRAIPLIPGTTLRDVAQSYFVDCGLSYQGWNTTADLWSITGGTTWEYPEVMNMVANTGAGFTAGDVGKQMIFREPVSQDLVKFDVISYVGTTTITVRPTTIVPVSLRGVQTTVHARALKTFGGLSHIEGKAVAILADGNVVGDEETGRLIVTGGSVTLPNFAAVVHIGLPFTSDLETLRINVQGQETLNDKHKTVSSVTLVVDESRGIFASAGEGKELFELKQREFEDYNSPTNMLSDTGRIDITNDWAGQGQVFIRQVDPLPLTVLAIIPELTIAGRK